MANYELAPIYRGEDRTYTVTVTDDAGDAVDLTDATMTLLIKADDDDAAADAKATVTATIAAPLTGVASLTITSTQTTALEKRKYHWVLTLTQGDGTVSKKAGRIPVLQA